jgi:hypothetical protein
VLQAQLQVATYTSESVPALRAIAAAIGGEEAAARAAVERVSAQLLAYTECGPEFADVVWQYGQVKVRGVSGAQPGVDRLTQARRGVWGWAGACRREERPAEG